MMKLSAMLGAGGLALLLWSFLPMGTSAPATAPATTSTAVAADTSRGRALFAAKGCATCHINTRASEARGECCGGVGPDLTNYTNDAALLRRWLADPQATKPGATMPNLNLSAAEIEDLIAFLNAPR